MCDRDETVTTTKYYKFWEFKVVFTDFWRKYEYTFIPFNALNTNDDREFYVEAKQLLKQNRFLLTAFGIIVITF